MLDVRSLSAEQGGVDFRWLSINHMLTFSTKLIKNQLTKLHLTSNISHLFLFLNCRNLRSIIINLPIGFQSLKNINSILLDLI